MLKRAYDILSRFKEYALVGVLMLVSLALLAGNDARQIQTMRSAAVVAVGILQDTFSFIPNFFALRRENDLLRELNLRLSDEVNRLREARLENSRLRQLLGLKARPAYTYVHAHVVGKNLQMLRNAITIDAGTRDGIGVNMPIVTESGLVGKIISAGPGYALGQILLSRDLRVSGKVQRSRVDGIVYWEGGRFLTLANVAKTLDVRTGDVVITSEYSITFPPGIRIGMVESARQVPGSLFQSIALIPAVDFLRLEEVAVILLRADSSRIALEGGLPRQAP